MKFISIIFFLLLVSSSNGQVKMEHTYTYDGSRSTFAPFRVDSATWKYVAYNRIDSISIYNLDHSLDRIIVIPIKDHTGNSLLYYCTRGLFQANTNVYDFLIWNTSQLDAFSETGDDLFGCVKCNFKSIINTEQGAKMLVDYLDGSFNLIQTSVFSLPGKLPGATIKLNVGSPGMAFDGDAVPTAAYPNPSNGRIHIEYALPDGITQGELIIVDMSGKEVRRYKIGNAFTDILIEKSDLVSGSYLYKVVTSKGESETKKILIRK